MGSMQMILYYRYSMKQEVFKPRYILHCGERPDFASLHKMAKDTFDQNENSWIAKYEATDLLEQIDIDELKVTEVLMPEEKAQLIRILENLKEDDNPVIMIATLKQNDMRQNLIFT